MPIWDKPLYNLKAKSGKSIIIDVTMSVNPALGPNQAITEVIEFFKRKKVRRIIDFGAGSLRHSLPLLKADFEVCAVDFEEQYVDSSSKRVCRQNRQEAEAYPNFSALVYPRDFIKDGRSFDAALLCYTFQGMPLISERKRVLKVLYKKLSELSYIVWMSRYGDAKDLPDSQRVEDGHYKYPTSSQHSFYTEFKTEIIHGMMQEVGWNKSFHHIRSLGLGGRDQLFVYAKRKKETWI
jgi:hypothetical protein